MVKRCKFAVIPGLVGAASAFGPSARRRSGAAAVRPGLSPRPAAPRVELRARRRAGEAGPRPTEEVAGGESSSYVLDERAFLEAMSVDLRALKDLASEHGALDEPAAAAAVPQCWFVKLDEATARMPHSSEDCYTRAVARCREIARRSVLETAAAAERDEEEEKKPFEPRHFGGETLNGFALMSLAVAAASIAAMNPAFDLDFPAVDLSSMNTVDVNALLSADLAEGTKQAVSSVISTVDVASDAAIKVQDAVASRASSNLDILRSQVRSIQDSLPAQFESARSAVSAQIDVVQGKAVAFQSKVLADTSAQFQDAKMEADTIQSRTAEAALGFQSKIHGAKETLQAQLDAARVGVHDTLDPVARRADGLASFVKQRTDSARSAAARLRPRAPRVEAPDFRTAVARYGEAEDAMLASFHNHVVSAKAALADGRDALLSRVAAARGAAAEAAAAAPLREPPSEAAALSTALPATEAPPPPGEVDDAAVELARTAMGVCDAAAPVAKARVINFAEFNDLL